MSKLILSSKMQMGDARLFCIVVNLVICRFIVYFCGCVSWFWFCFLSTSQ